MNTLVADVANLLKSELESRMTRNPKYSLRAFARDLEISASRLSRLLSGERGISREAADQLAGKLGLSEKERDYFLQLVDAKHARAKKVKAAARSKLALLSADYQAVDAEAFKVVSEWYHFAILSYLETEGAETSPEAVAESLGIAPFQARQAIERLLKNGMIERAGSTLRPTGVFFANADGVPSRAVRDFHEQILQKARVALQTQTIEERNYSALVIAVDPDDLPEARIFIKTFREEFERRFCQSAKRKRQVMALGIQLHRLSGKPEAKGKAS